MGALHQLMSTACEDPKALRSSQHDDGLLRRWSEVGAGDCDFASSRRDGVEVLLSDEKTTSAAALASPAVDDWVGERRETLERGKAAYW